MSIKQFELRFEGPIDSSANTLRQIKGVFVADLDFPITDVQRFIESAPVTIKQADSEAELLHAHGLLERAGAKVLIIKDSGQSDINGMEFEPLELEFEKVLDHSATELVNNSDIEPLELNFEFQTDSPSNNNTLDLSTNLEFTDLIKTEEPKDNGAISNTENNEYDLSLASDLALDINNFDTLKFEDSPPEDKSTASQNEVFNTSDLSLEADQNEAIPDKSGVAELTLSETTRPESAQTESTPKTEDSQKETELELFMPLGSTLLGNEDSSLNQAEAIEQANLEEDSEQTLKKPDASKTENSFKEDSDVARNEEIIELTLEQLKSLQTPQKKKQSNTSLILATLLCCLVLAYLNTIVFSSTERSNPFESLIASLPQTSTAENKALTTVTTENLNTSWYKSQNIFSDRSYKASVWVENKIPVHASIEVNSPKPAALTKEEIVNKIPDRAWLKRIDIKDLIFKKENDLFLASGPALAYFQLADRNLRVTGQANFVARVDEATGNISLEIKATSNDLSPLGSNTEKPAPNLSFGLNDQSASGKDYFFYTENILLEKP